MAIYNSTSSEVCALKDALLEAGVVDFGLDDQWDTSTLKSIVTMEDVKLEEDAALLESVLNKTDLETSILLDNSIAKAICFGDISDLDTSSDEDQDDDEKSLKELEKEAALLKAALIETETLEDALVEVAASVLTVDDNSSDENYDEYLSKKISSKRRRTKKHRTDMETVISRNGKRQCMDSERKKDTSPSTCICREHNGDDWIGCNGKGCEDAWFHLGCVGLSEEDVVEMGYFYCFRCVAKYV